MRYRIRLEHGKLRLHIAVATALLSQVKGEPRFWRLETDTKAKRGRLTGLVQNDGQAATRKQPLYEKATTGFTWGISDATAGLFPDKGKVTPLLNFEVTSLGVEFDLP